MPSSRILKLPALGAVEMLQVLQGLQPLPLHAAVEMRMVPEGSAAMGVLLADPFDAAQPHRRALLTALQQAYARFGAEPAEEMLEPGEAPAGIGLEDAPAQLWWRAALRPAAPLPAEADAPLLVFDAEDGEALMEALPDALLHPTALRLYAATDARRRQRLLLWLKDDAARGSTAAALLASGRLPPARALHPVVHDGPALFLPEGMQADADATAALLALEGPGAEDAGALLLAALPEADGSIALLRLAGLAPVERQALAAPLLAPRDVAMERWSADETLREGLQRRVSQRLGAAGMRLRLVDRAGSGAPGAAAQLQRLRLRAAALQQQIAFLAAQLPDAPELLLIPHSDAEGVAQLLQDLMLAEHPPEDAAHALLDRDGAPEPLHALLLQGAALRLPAVQSRLRRLPEGWQRFACDAAWVEAYGGAQSGSLLMVPAGKGLTPLPHAWAAGDGELALRRFAEMRGAHAAAGPQLYLIAPQAGATGDSALDLAVLPRLGFVPVLRRTEWLNDLLLQGWLMQSQRDTGLREKLAKGSREMQMAQQIDRLAKRNAKALQRYRTDVEKEAQLTLALLWRELATAMSRSAATLKRIAQLRSDGEGLMRVLQGLATREQPGRRALGEVDVASREAAVALQRLGVALAQVERGEAAMAGQRIPPVAAPPQPPPVPATPAPADAGISLSKEAQS